MTRTFEDSGSVSLAVLLSKSSPGSSPLGFGNIGLSSPETCQGQWIPDSLFIRSDNDGTLRISDTNRPERLGIIDTKCLRSR